MDTLVVYSYINPRGPDEVGATAVRGYRARIEGTGGKPTLSTYEMYICGSESESRRQQAACALA